MPQLTRSLVLFILKYNTLYQSAFKDYDYAKCNSLNTDQLSACELQSMTGGSLPGLRAFS